MLVSETCCIDLKESFLVFCRVFLIILKPKPELCNDHSKQMQISKRADKNSKYLNKKILSLEKYGFFNNWFFDFCIMWLVAVTQLYRPIREYREAPAMTHCKSLLTLDLKLPCQQKYTLFANSKKFCSSVVIL